MLLTMSNVFIRLTPLDYFFFGGRRTFGSDNANYFVRSRLFPQQTSVIGLLRHQMLRKGQEIGESFDAGNSSGQTFGPLQSISAVFLCKEEGGKPGPDNMYWVYPLDAQLDEQGENNIKRLAFSLSSNALFLTSDAEGAAWQNASVFSGYDPKASLIEKRYANGNGEKAKGKDVFSSTVRVGITKRHRSRPKPDDKEKERGFYKQEVYKLKNGWSFGFIAEFNNTFDPMELNDAITPFGGERSLFKINVSEQEQPWRQLEKEFNAGPFGPAGGNKFILLSDAFVEKGIYQQCAGAITQTIDFQNIHTPKGKEVQHAALTDKPKEEKYKLYKSGKYQLLQRGSVLYAADNGEQLGKLKDALEAAANFRNIGYNQFIIR